MSAVHASAGNAGLIDSPPTETAIERAEPSGMSQLARDVAQVLRSTRSMFTGRLEKIEVRIKPFEPAGQHVPVLCLEFVSDAGAVPFTVRAERPFPDRDACDKAAASLKRGQRITVTAPLLGMRVYLPGVEIVPEQPKDTQ